MKKLTILGQELALRASPSFMQKAACPLALKLAYIDKVEDRYIRVNTLRGSAAHDAIAELTRIAVKDDIPVRELSNEMVADAVNKHTPHEIMSEMQEILRCVLLWRDRFVIGDGYMGREEKIALDEDFEETTWDAASYRGIIDYIEGKASSAIITDYKMSPHVLSQAELDGHEQLTHYAWLTSKMYPHLKVFLCRIWYLRYGFYGESRRTAEDLALYEHTLLMKLAKLQDIESWDPMPGEQCGVCDYVHLCPIGNDLSQPARHVVTQQQAELAASRLRVMEGLVSGLRKSLANYVKSNDAIRLSGNFIYGYRTSTSPTYDPEKLELLLREHGVSLSKVVSTVDAKKIAAFLRMAEREDPILAEEIIGLQNVKGRSEFRGYKITDDAEGDPDVD